MAGVAIFVRKSMLHLDDWGVKKGNSYSLLVMIDWTGTYIITYDIIFDTENFPKEGYNPLKPNPQPPPPPPRLLRLWSVGYRQRREGVDAGKAFSSQTPSAKIKGCLEAPYLLTTRMFSICEPHFQEFWEMKCLSPRTVCLLLHPTQLQCLIY